MTSPDLTAAATVIDRASEVVATATRRLATAGSIDDHQVLAYDLAHAASAVETARGLLDYGGKGDLEGRITCAFVADAVHDLASKVFGREADWGVEPGVLDDTRGFLATYRAAEFLAGITDPGPRHLDDDFEMVQDTFRRFADAELAPIAEHIHRRNEDIPEKIITGLAEMGAFGLSIPTEYGGYGEGGEGEYIAMVVATEELSRGSLGAGGSLITRPEILTRALLAGGTEEQKQEWLPRLATAEIMNAVAVTEPDYGSDVAGVKVNATRTDDGSGWLITGVKTWCTFGARADVLMLLARTDADRSKGHRGLSLFIVPKPRGEGHGFEFVQEAADGAPGGGKMEGRWLINGVKTWCTFGARATVLMLLARTDPDRSKAHRGLSMFVVPKPLAEGHGFEFAQEAGADDGAPGGGKMEGRPIDTIGYRGMHSYEVAFDSWFVPAENLIGLEAGEGRGFYYQMAGFENGRLQTAARAVGVMQAAYEAARTYAEDRVVFGKPIGDYQLTQAKLGRMAVVIQSARQFSYAVARMMAKGEGALEASMVKAYVCKAAEWVTREAMQIHGGMGYAEEYDVSRYFVDARVLSIFEGADETLCLKVIARRMVEQAKPR
jgi:(2S)-methylsuccinyl-CoA dehydrogenase